jgi:histidinol dehydrogenase
MIRIQQAASLEPSFFAGRDFGASLDTVKDVINAVRKEGDQALHSYSKQFDGMDPVTFEIPHEELQKAAARMESGHPDLYHAIEYSHDLALRFAQKQRESFDDFEVELEPGMFTGQKNIPVRRAGVYIPAGRFPLVSTVVMTITPAVAAGVQEIMLCTPPRIHPQGMESGLPYADEGILAAAYICGATRVFACGGAQAIAAMALGTQSIPSVDVIVGPGNKYVAEAKKLLYGTVGIDMVAGPTEVFIIADSSARPDWVAADLLAQAEHDIVAQPVLATPDAVFAQKVAQEIEKQLDDLPTKETAAASIQNCGRIIVTGTLEEAADIANRKAPEHLELAVTPGPVCDALVQRVYNYGSLFIGHESAEVFGDYAAGLNHTLPTSGCARFTGGLSVRVFLKTVTTLRSLAGSAGAIASARASGIIGDAEGLAGHARAARIRLHEKE